MPALVWPAQSITELISIRAAQQGDHYAVHTGAAEFGDSLQTLTFSDLSKAVDRLAAHYAALGLQPTVPADEIPPERIIAVLTSTAIDETLLEIALAKLGLASLLLSVNNSVAAIAHLCKQTRAACLLYGSKFEQTAKEAQAQLAGEGYQLDVQPEKRFPLWGKGGESKRTCVILHSSGSTGFPKPVYITHYGLLANASLSYAKTGFSALPLFHGFGHFSIFRCFFHGKAFTLLPPHLPITSGNIVKTVAASPSPPEMHYAVPYVLKLLAETEEGIECLAGFEAVSYAGAAVPDDLGDRLVERGVNLVSFYGTTETGGLMTSRRDCAVDKGWNWLRAEGSVADYLELAPHGSDTFEIIVKDGWPAKILSNREDGAYCTKDLMQRHPTHKTWFKYIGRLDDTLTQTLGEKTNPVPIELAIRGNSPLIQEAIVFGDARPQVGVLIAPSEQGAELSKDTKVYIETIWPVIAEANATAPSHSRILPEMVEVLPYGTEIPVATKMSILRPACYKKFADVIQSVYDRFERGTGAPKQNIDTAPELEAFLTNLIRSAMGDKAGADLTPSTDLFSYGVDSLQATRVRNDILKQLELGDAKLGQNIVYEHPSIAQLARHILDAKSGRSGEQRNVQKIMLDYVEKWSAKLVHPSPSPSAERPSGEVVVLTGATGSLGAHILDQLTRRPEVAKVICLSRAKSHADSEQRLADSLTQRQRNLTPEAHAKVASLAADVNRPDLGLTADEYAYLRNNLTTVIHNAWPVNFVLSLESYDEHIGGAVNLINLARSSPRAATSSAPSFFFSSSVSTTVGRPDPNVYERFSDSPSTANATGYGQSKWVVEKLVEKADLDTPGALRMGVFRIGQLAGDTENGVWNETEAWPLMFRAANTTGTLPDLDERPTWLPVDLAGRAISEIALSPRSAEGGAELYHVLSNQPTPWRDILEGLKRGGLEYSAVDRFKWLENLASSEADVAKNPTYKLLGFYQGRMGNTTERAPQEYIVCKASALSPAIASVQPISPKLVALWVSQWKKSGFLV